MALLETKNVTFTYPDEKKPALQNISLTVNRGEFLVIAGPSGSGKSTLLRLLKQEIAPVGELSGEILYNGKPLHTIDRIKTTKEIGMIFQDPENQLVMDRVLDELIFGMENLGMDTLQMRKKVAEFAHFFGIHSLLNKPIHELSGGQKQLVNLASVLLMEPTLLLLDEPTAQLDPVAAKDFLHMVDMINKEFGIAIIMVEHHLDHVLPLCDRMIVIEQGKISLEGNPRHIIETIQKHEQSHFHYYLPNIARLFLTYQEEKSTCSVPLTVREGREWIQQLSVLPIDEPQIEHRNDSQRPFIEVKNIVFQYDKNGEKILDHLNLSIHEGEFLAIVGANGTGKSTLLKVIAGLESPIKGKVLYQGRKLKGPQPGVVHYLPQNPKLLFIHDTIREELEALVERQKGNDPRERLQELLQFFNVEDFLDRHPFDISGGELQKLAIIMVLLTDARVLLLDEPTKGLDPEMKHQLGKLLQQLQKRGMTIIMVTHDLEFAASYSSRCAMMFQGTVTAISDSQDFFRGNTFYTTAINRITRNTNVPEVTTLEEARRVWKLAKNH